MTANRARRPTRTLLDRIAQRKPTVTVWFCGSCGCHDRSEEHAADCDWEQSMPRVAVKYLCESMQSYVGECGDCGGRTAGSLHSMPRQCGGCDSTNLKEAEVL